MNVKQLIKELEKVDDKEKEVYVYDDGVLLNISLVDLSIDDRVDLNVNESDIDFMIKELKKAHFNVERQPRFRITNNVDEKFLLERDYLDSFYEDVKNIAHHVIDKED